MASRANQSGQGATDRIVIVHDEHKRFWLKHD
jgi:hypothetical protein